MIVVIEYVWLGGNSELRSKGRFLNLDLEQDLLSQIPSWNYDGSSTAQAVGSDSEVVIKPVSVFKDPFRKGENLLVMCDTWKPDGTALENNARPWALNLFSKNLDEEPWFGIEQEYFLMNPRTGKPLGFPQEGEPQPQGPYYCAVGTGNVYGRGVADDHLLACIHAGIKMSGINGEVAPGQWEYQVGPCTGIESGDHLWMSRYLLERVAEKHGICISYHPKPVPGNWNGSGCHTNYSTKSMREGTSNQTGLQVIEDALDKLAEKHDEHMQLYGSGNELRMTGEHETSDYRKFTYGRANRGASVRIGNETIQNEKGYFEDRRPSSNMNPYLVTAKIFETTVLNNVTNDDNFEPQPSDNCSF